MSSLLREFLIQSSESATSFTESLIHAAVGSAGIEPTSRTHTDDCSSKLEIFGHESQHNHSTTMFANRGELWGTTGNPTDLENRDFSSNSLLLKGFWEGCSGMSNRFRKPMLYPLSYGSGTSARRFA